MNLVLLGPPGAGKGTQAARIAEQYHIPQISTGEILREVAQQPDGLGARVGEYINHGLMVPDEIILDLVWRRLAQSDAQAGFVLDGFPRTMAQAEALDRSLSSRVTAESPGSGTLDAVLDLEVDEEELIRRLSGRRVCPKCGASYHLVSKPPRVDQRCDRDGATLEQRKDDQPEAIRERLKLYHQRTEPVLDYYRAKGLLHRVEGDREMGQVARQIAQILEQQTQSSVTGSRLSVETSPRDTDRTENRPSGTDH
jgi:adenylate kinase